MYGPIAPPPPHAPPLAFRSHTNQSTYINGACIISEQVKHYVPCWEFILMNFIRDNKLTGNDILLCTTDIKTALTYLTERFGYGNTLFDIDVSYYLKILKGVSHWAANVCERSEFCVSSGFVKGCKQVRRRILLSQTVFLVAKKCWKFWTCSKFLCEIIFPQTVASVCKTVVSVCKTVVSLCKRL